MKIPTSTMLKVLWMTNLSKRAMQIETATEVQPDTRIKVALVLPGTELLVDATVKRCMPDQRGRGFFVGVEFAELTDAQRAAIEQIVGTVKEIKTKPDRKEADLDDTDIDLDE